MEEKGILEEFKLDNIVANDIITGEGEKLLRSGWLLDPKSGKFRPAITGSPALDIPWIYVRPDNDKDCGFWHQVIFDTYNLVPVGCFGCWKVVVRPRSLTELFKLLIYQQDVYKGHCKCGIELRKYVHGNYGGYFYNRSVEEGLECYKTVRKAVDERISPQVAVTLKRGCTEYELKFGDSSKWEQIAETGKYEKEGQVLTTLGGQKLLDRIDLISNNVERQKKQEVSEGCFSTQPVSVKVAVIRSWIEHAYSIGDPTALDYNDGPFYTPPVTYHNRVITVEEAEGFRKFVQEEEALKR